MKRAEGKKKSGIDLTRKLFLASDVSKCDFRTFLSKAQRRCSIVDAYILNYVIPKMLMFFAAINNFYDCKQSYHLNYFFTEIQ